ncbi:MAG: hypothetical protein ABR521_12215 [Gaiellaceae bacterium]
MIFRKRFSELVRRQLDLFASEHAALLKEVAQAEEAFVASDRDEAEERYGDFADRVEWAMAELESLRDTYAATLDESAAAGYARAFDRAARGRFPHHAWAYTDY